MTGRHARYTELQVTTNYSFLRGASHIEELIARAAVLRHAGAGASPTGTPWPASSARISGREEAGIRLIIGCRLDLTDGPSVLVYPTNRAGYSRLTRLLTLGKGRAGKGKCELHWPDLAAAAEGPDRHPLHRPHRSKYPAPESGFRRPGLCRADPDAPPQRCRAAAHHRRYWPAPLGVPTVATNDVLYHAPGRRILQDVLTCIREGCTIDELGYRRERSAVRHLAAAGGNGPAVRPPSRCHRPHAGNRRPLPVHPGRTALPVSARGPHSRPDRATNTGATDLGRRRRTLSGWHSRQRRRSNFITNSS